MQTLQITTTNTRSFFNKQVEFLRKKGVECDILALAPGKVEYDKIVDRLGPIGKILPEFGYTARFAGINVAISYPRLVAKTSFNNYDVIHANSGLCAPFAALQLERPIVQTFWGTDLMGSYAFGHYDKICKLASRHFEASIVRNEAMRNELQGHANAHIIPAGVDLEMFHPIDATKACNEICWAHGAHHILFPYRPWTSRKNFAVAEKAVNVASEKLDEPIHLQIIHDKPFGNMPYYYNAADALILPSDLEGSPNTVKEAMACNTPVIATDVGDVSKLLANVCVSTVVDTPAESHVNELAQGIITAVNANGQADSREQVEHLGWNQTADRIISVYEEILPTH
jgi:teichuronic acid biosynthesis glycosyltransferase TuaC